MREVKSCGVLVVRATPDPVFLLMKHPHRYDLPKGHLREGESEMKCALRELHEETGIAPDLIRLHPSFRYETSYTTPYKRFGGELVEKTLVVFIGYIDSEPDILAREHGAYEWIAWNPPHSIQPETIDALLTEAERILGR